MAAYFTRHGRKYTTPEYSSSNFVACYRSTGFLDCRPISISAFRSTPFSLKHTISSGLVGGTLDTLLHVDGVDFSLTGLHVQLSVLHVQVLLGLTNTFGEIAMDQAGVRVVFHSSMSALHARDSNGKFSEPAGLVAVAKVLAT